MKELIQKYKEAQTSYKKLRDDLINEIIPVMSACATDYQDILSIGVLEDSLDISYEYQCRGQWDTDYVSLPFHVLYSPDPVAAIRLHNQEQKELRKKIDEQREVEFKKGQTAYLKSQLESLTGKQVVFENQRETNEQ
jgi:hypothetical protein